MLKKLFLFLMVSAVFFVSISKAVESPAVIQTSGSVRSSTVRPLLNLPSPGEIPPNSGGSRWNPWIDKEDSVQAYQDLVTTYDFGDWESVGKSSSGSYGGDPNWDIVMFKFGNPNGGIVMIDTDLHGNEYYGYQCLKSVITWLASSNDADAVRIRQNNCVLVVPVANYRQGRTNFNIHSTNDDPAGGDLGVNLNRNFSPSFNLHGAGTDDYSGSYADSERESQALINAWNTYHPRVYLNIHQGIGPSVMVTARSTFPQAVEDANAIDTLLPQIQSTLGSLTPGQDNSAWWGFNVGSSYGQGYSKDGAASRGAVGILLELWGNEWHSDDPAIKANLETGNTFKQLKAMFISMCQAVESTTQSLSTVTGQWYHQDSVLMTPMHFSDANLQLKFVKETDPS